MQLKWLAQLLGWSAQIKKISRTIFMLRLTKQTKCQTKITLFLKKDTSLKAKVILFFFAGVTQGIYSLSINQHIHTHTNIYLGRKCVYSATLQLLYFPLQSVVVFSCDLIRKKIKASLMTWSMQVTNNCPSPPPTGECWVLQLHGPKYFVLFTVLFLTHDKMAWLYHIFNRFFPPNLIFVLFSPSVC